MVFALSDDCNKFGIKSKYSFGFDIALYHGGYMWTRWIYVAANYVEFRTVVAYKT